jgi:hypothetical protein
MAQAYITVTSYLVSSRNRLQDLIAPYRYTDGQIVSALDTALAEMGRVRPDIFLDLKYQRPLKKGDLNDGMPGGYGLADLSFQSDGITYNPGGGTIVPVPVKYITPIHWFMDGWLQFQDVTDTQDQRAQGFMQKFQTQLMTLSAA